MDGSEVSKRRVDWVGGRKFLLVVAVLVVGTVLLVGKFVTVEEFREWANAAFLTISSYFGGNVANKFATRPTSNNTRRGDNDPR